MERVKYSDLLARIDQLVLAGADLSIHSENGYWVISNKAESAGYLCSGTKADCARWIHGYATAWYAKR